MTTGTDRATDSRWWYWIVLTPFYAMSVLLFGFGLTATVLLGESTDFAVFLPAFLALGLLSIGFGVAFPLSLYKDALTIEENNRGWNPSGVLYGSAGAVAVVTGFLLTIPLALYYLYRRHEQVGVP